MPSFPWDGKRAVSETNGFRLSRTVLVRERNEEQDSGWRSRRGEKGIVGCRDPSHHINEKVGKSYLPRSRENEPCTPFLDVSRPISPRREESHR